MTRAPHGPYPGSFWSSVRQYVWYVILTQYLPYQTHGQTSIHVQGPPKYLCSLPPLRIKNASSGCVVEGDKVHTMKNKSHMELYQIKLNQSAFLSSGCLGNVIRIHILGVLVLVQDNGYRAIGTKKYKYKRKTDLIPRFLSIRLTMFSRLNAMKTRMIQNCSRNHISQSRHPLSLELLIVPSSRANCNAMGTKTPGSTSCSLSNWLWLARWIWCIQ